jgi:hypothetical protein
MDALLVLEEGISLLTRRGLVLSRAEGFRSDLKKLMWFSGSRGSMAAARGMDVEVLQRADISSPDPINRSNVFRGGGLLLATEFLNTASGLQCGEVPTGHGSPSNGGYREVRRSISKLVVYQLGMKPAASMWLIQRGVP